MRITFNAVHFRVAAKEAVADYWGKVPEPISPAGPDRLNIVEQDMLIDLMQDTIARQTPTHEPTFAAEGLPRSATKCRADVVATAAYDSEGLFAGTAMDAWITWYAPELHTVRLTHSPDHFARATMAGADTLVDQVVVFARTVVDNLNQRLYQDEQAWTSVLAQSSAA